MRYFRKGVSCLLAALMILVMLPAAALAEGEGESVLTAIGHTAAISTVTLSGSTRSVTLTVPYSYMKDDPNAAIDLTDGLDIDYDHSIYEEVVATPDPANTLAPVDGSSAVTVTVSYKKKADASTGSTDYEVSAVRAEAVQPTFTGTINKSRVSAGTVTFSASDFTDRYKKNDGKDLEYIEIWGSNPGFGELQLSSDPYTLRDKISVGDLSDLTFEAADGGSVSYTAKAYAAGETTSIGSVTITITVTGVPKITSSILKSTYVENTYTFSLSDFSGCYDLNNGTLQNIEITPANTAYGTWYRNSTPLAADSPTTFAAGDIGSLKFTGSAEGTASFTWKVSNAAGYSAPGSGSVTVNAIQAPTITGSVSKSVSAGSTLIFSLSDFSSCYNLNNGTLDSIEITPIPSSYGTWYSGSTAFTAAKAFTAANISSGSLKLAGAARGTVAFTWRVSNQSGYSASGTGTVTVVNALALTSYAPTITVDRGTTWTIAASHFSYTPTTKQIAYVKIKTIPASASGYLYLTTAVPADATYGYPAISAGAALSANAVIPYGYLQYLKLATYVTGTASAVSFTWTATTDSYISSAVWASTVSYTVNFSDLNVSYETDENTPVDFVSSDFSSAYAALTGYTLSYVKFTLPASNRGTLYYDYDADDGTGTAVKSSTTIYRSSSSSPNISDVTFVPYTGYTGTVTITYYAYNSSGAATTCTMTIVVNESDDVATITYETGEDEPVTFLSSDFNTAYYNATYSTLSYVKFTLPPSNRGTLYYNYDEDTGTGTAVKSTTTIYRSTSSTPNISDVTFVPYTGYTGTVTITYYAYNSSGAATTCTLQIIVGASGETVKYETDEGVPVDFVAADFNNAYYNKTGYTLSYVKFALPASNRGTLYYNYDEDTGTGTAVKSTTTVYRSTSSTPSISDVTFVPYTGYTGTLIITYYAYNSSGAATTCTMTIVVGASGETVSYETLKDVPVTFASTDFNTAYYNKTGGTLSYVKFTLPASNRGTLYYNYNASAGTGTAVKSTTTVYRSASSTPSISDVTFVPASGYTGTVTITYYAYNSAGTSTTCTMTIVVKASGNLSAIAYSTVENKPVTFAATDFNTVYFNATQTNLSYVKFTLPAANRGTLYYGYDANAGTGTAVKSTTAVYRSTGNTPNISDVTFVPYTGFTGTVTITYTAYNTSGTSKTGTVNITITKSTGASAYFTDVTSSYAWASAAIDYLYEKGTVAGVGDKKYSPAANMIRGDFMLILYRAFSFAGTPSSGFGDVPASSYYYAAINAAKAKGIAKGDGDKFYPQTSITRQDAMVLIVRTLEVSGINLTAGGSSDLAAFTDKGSISSYATTALATLVKAGVVQGSGGKINPLSNITRAEIAVILYRILTR